MSMIRTNCTPRRRSGAATAELAIVLIFIFMPFALGMWEGARLVEVQQVVANAAREGGRHASTGQSTNDAVQRAVCTYLKNAGLPDYTSQRTTIVTVTNLTHSGVDCTAATDLDQIQVTVTIPFNDVRWINLYLITDTTTQVTFTATWTSMRDLDYPTPTPPVGF
jgi:Flp pilus assembly protein TadG